MGTSFITCDHDEALSADNMDQFGFWAHDPYTALTMQLVGKEFLKCEGDEWKQAVGKDLILRGKHGGDGCTFPPLDDFNDSRERLVAFRDAYHQVDRFLASLGDVISDKFLRDNDMVGMLLSGPDDVPTREVREEAQQVIRLIDEYLARNFPTGMSDGDGASGIAVVR